MTVKQAIEKLKKLPDQQMKLLLDCPHCGHAHQLASFDQIVVVRGKEEEVI